MSDRYRIVLTYLADRDVFRAHAVELAECIVEGKTRAEAVAAIEEDIVLRLQHMQREGVTPAPPLDAVDAPAQLTLAVSGSLHRDLSALAREAGVTLDAYLTEQLTRLALSGRWAGHARRGERPRRGEREGAGPRRGESTGSRYNAIMDNRADFIEYVRGLEGGGSGRRNRR